MTSSDNWGITSEYGFPRIRDDASILWRQLQLPHEVEIPGLRYWARKMSFDDAPLGYTASLRRQQRMGADVPGNRPIATVSDVVIQDPPLIMPELAVLQEAIGEVVDEEAAQVDDRDYVYFLRVGVELGLAPGTGQPGLGNHRFYGRRIDYRESLL